MSFRGPRKTVCSYVCMFEDGGSGFSGFFNMSGLWEFVLFADSVQVY